MKNFSLKALGAFIFAAGLVVAGVAGIAAPAQATGGVQITANGSLPTFTAGQAAPAFSINVDPNGTSLYNTESISISLNQQWTNTSCSGTLPACGVSLSGLSLANGAPAPTVSRGNGFVNLLGISSQTAPFVVNFDNTVWTVPSAGGNYTLGMHQGSMTLTVPSPPTCDSGTGGYVFILKGNNGLTSNGLDRCNYLSASASTVAPSNVYTRDGYTFTGWNTAADGSGTSYAPGASVTALSQFAQSRLYLFAQWSQGNMPPAVSSSLTLSATTGQLIAGSTVAVSASGLQSTAAYTVTVESTPQTIGTGNAVSGAVSTNVTLPSGLEAGWHTLTFTSTASDGSSVVSKYYFKISASGTLLSTSSTIPAELANTGINAGTGISLLAGGLSLALVGAEMFMIARRKRNN